MGEVSLFRPSCIRGALLFALSPISNLSIGIGLDIGDGKGALGKGGDAGLGTELLEALNEGLGSVFFMV